jgi:arylsulfatase A-like enzyme
MKRRTFIELTGASFALGALGASGFKFTTSRKPYNVLIIHTDEHNFRTLGCYRRALPEKEALMWGPPTVETPHIDSIADRGLTADAHYCASPICSPSRASFVSGLYPMDTDVIDNDIPMRDDTETFADVLGRAGYATGYAGKWHLDGDPFPGWAPARRFGFADNRYMFNRGHWKQVELTADGPEVAKDSRGREIYNAAASTPENYTTDWLADRAVDFLEEHREHPFCYMLSIPDPQGPDSVREPYASLYKGAPFEKPYTAGRERSTAPSWGLPIPEDKKLKTFDIATYYGMVKCIDDNVGKILKKLDALGLTENTIVIFTADHGDMMGEQDRINKGVPYEASAKIPFVIAAPGLIPAGTRTSAAISTVDFKPTLLGLLGLSSANPSHGRDRSALFCGRKAAADCNELIFSRSPGVRGGTGWLMATDGRFKLIASLNPPEPIWLIDLKSDPEERVNQADNPEFAPVVQSMSAALLDYAVRYKDPNLEMGGVHQKLAEAAQ